MKLNKKKLVIYIITMAVLILLLVFSSGVIQLATSSDFSLKKINFSDIPENTEPVVVTPTFVYNGGILETVYVTGWAFCETEHDNSEKQINLVFKNIDSDTAFISHNSAQLRLDVYGAFAATKKIYNGMNGYYSEFSTFIMPNGVYELYINVVENEYNYGIATTNCFYKKAPDKFYEVNSDGSDFERETNEESDSETDFVISSVNEVNLILEESNPSGTAWIDAFDCTGTELSVSGWGSYSAETNNEQTLYLAVRYFDGTVKYYPTEENSRTDVAIAYNDTSYTSCGFYISVPIDENIEKFNIFIVSEIQGKCYKLITNGQTSYPVGESTVVTQEPSAAETTVTAESDGETPQTAVSVSLALNEDNQVFEQGLAYVDMVTIENGFLNIIGWGSVSPETNGSQQLILAIDASDSPTQYFIPETISRNDVADHFNDESYLYCGFCCIIPFDETRDYNINVLSLVNNTYYHLITKGTNVIENNILDETT